MTTFLQQGAAEAASRVRERVGASLRLQTSESVQDIWVCFCFCFFYLRVFGEQSGCLFRECLRGIGTPRVHFARLVFLVKRALESPRELQFYLYWF